MTLSGKYKVAVTEPIPDVLFRAYLHTKSAPVLASFERYGGEPLNPRGVKEQEEQYTYFEVYPRKRGWTETRVQYDYRTFCGDLFSCVRKTLTDCRKARDKWYAEYISLMQALKTPPKPKNMKLKRRMK